MAAGVVARRTTPIDPHTGLPPKPIAQTYAEGLSAQREQTAGNMARSNENAARERALADAQRAQNMGVSGSTGYTGAQGTVQYSSNGGSMDGSASTRRSGGSGVAGGNGPRVSLDALLTDYSKVSGPEPAPIVGPPRADRTAANDAAYGAAKAKIGLQNRASLNSLRNVMSERNISGSGIEAMADADVIGHGQSDLADVVLNQTGAGLARDQAVEDRDYAGGITQRGQDMQQRQAKRAAIEELFRMRTGTGYSAPLY